MISLPERRRLDTAPSIPKTMRAGSVEQLAPVTDLVVGERSVPALGPPDVLWKPSGHHGRDFAADQAETVARDLPLRP